MEHKKPKKIITGFKKEQKLKKKKDKDIIPTY